MRADILISRLETSMDLIDEQMAAVHRQSLEYAWPASGFREILNMPSVVALGAFAQHLNIQHLVGFICFQKTNIMCDTLALCVLPEYRRLGIGSELIRWMVDLCSGEQNMMYTLEVAQNNVDALRLYERWGFTIQGTRPQYYRTASGAISAHVMTCFFPKSEVL